MGPAYTTISVNNPDAYAGFGAGAYPPAGYQADGTPLWVAFDISYQNSLQVGKFTPSFGQALFPFGGQELGTGALDFNVIVSSLNLVDGALGIIPGAIVLGYDVGGEPLFGVMAYLPPDEGGYHPGKTKFSFNGLASIGYGGTEVFVNSYFLLVGGI
jgi:hypothetical protein